MNVLFLTIGVITDVNDRNIYSDLLRAFIKNGHRVYAISPNERKHGDETELTDNGCFKLLRVRTGNLQKCNVIEKGISTLLIERQYKKAIERYFGNVRFDLILYSTPPITFANVVEFVKKRDRARSYLMLKDIFPQNAVDMGMMSKKGIKAPLYRYFREKEKKLYALSDRIGCMSQANVDYLLRHNGEVSPDKVEICPNSIEATRISCTAEERAEIRKKYDIPADKKVFVYGGNLGKPQGIPFITECIKAAQEHSEAFFLVVGNGTEYDRISSFAESPERKNIKLMKSLPKEEYDRMISACDVGLIFLDHRFTIPNFPSRLLSYMQASLPVLACTDPCTDIGQVITEGGFGWWCESNSADGFSKTVSEILNADLVSLGENGYKYLMEHYTVDIQYGIIAKDMDCKESI